MVTLPWVDVMVTGGSRCVKSVLELSLHHYSDMLNHWEKMFVMPSFHAFTESDTTSQFAGRGRRQPGQHGKFYQIRPSDRQI